ncbi:dethiobiotin synthase [Saprospira grandis DSM 2844]|uniref:ATP-dependent dethiobiotin synthetase BioD n=1 Tax=Saprospira grandis DSM 2844 TaxID=694433 RepID=J0P193_9BACT|nr:dethiobiotin synthase [Saprospira grandis]EJF53564.1 dethiobiotin synthase [Saprospira grandis DSM 2844]
MSNNAFFLSGIGTEIGKTLVSAILVKALKMDYWKPVQSGELEYTDTDKVRDLVQWEGLKTHPERYRLEIPASPHYSARAEGKKIELEQLVIPKTDNNLLIEGAGGLMVPLNEEELYIDWAARQKLPVILVSQNYLGSINHTILSIEALKARGLTEIYLLFNGPSTPSTEEFILNYSQLTCLGRVEQAEGPVDAAFVAQEAKRLKSNFEKILKK